MPVPGDNHRYKHSINLTRNQKQQKQNANKTNYKNQPSASTHLWYSFANLEREGKKITHNLQIQPGHEE